ncbi:protein dispatched homolog 1-like isoform X2 [Lineus longissimus]|uniref:protein dispatched homolog 1-like isoform X2 n=1 Tax=Lineus longissimus TaxID=88925 RepID=UPI00315D3334
MGYSRVLAHYPAWVITAVLLFAATCLVISIAIGDRLDFSDPKAGFEPRGTTISQRYLSWENLIDQTARDETSAKLAYHNRGSAGLHGQKDGMKGQLRTAFQASYNTTYNYTYKDEDYIEDVEMPFQAPTYFCDKPNVNHARVVFGHAYGGNLFSASNIHAMCDIEEAFIRQQEAFNNACIRADLQGRGPCCRSWSLGNYVALLANKTKCQDITNRDIDYVVMLLNKCSGFYSNFSLEYNCWDIRKYSRHPCSVHESCQRENAIFHILHYITDIGFMKDSNNEKNDFPFLKYAITFLPVAAGSATETLYKEMENTELRQGDVEVVAINFGIKFTLFDDYLKTDTVWIGISVTIIFLSIWLYTTSLFITSMTISAVAFSLLISYFLYTMVFEIKFFPFMNLLVVVIAIGIGADDVFVYCKVWHLAKSEKNNGTLEKIVTDTLKHATLSMFVTSFTTAAAFYANYVSDITAIRCFAIYAGTTVVANFLMMVTWIPATIVIQEKYCSCCVFFSPDVYTQEKNVCYYLCKVPYTVYYCLSDWARIFFEKILPCVVIKVRYLWVILGSTFGICGFVFIFYHPNLSLPSSNEFQVFASTHPFEVYDYQIRDKFWFEKAAGTSIPMMPLTIVWGVKPIDNGNKLNPKNTGDMILDDTFDLMTPNAQIWLLKFCRRLRMVEFYDIKPGLQSLTNCFIENFKRWWMERPCIDGDGKSLEPCCVKSEFPYQRDVFLECLRLFTPEVDRLSYGNGLAGPRYSKETGEIVALIVEFSSNVPFSYSYDEMHHFFTVMNDWTRKEMQSAPPEIANGWFVSQLKFFDLQNSIAYGTPVAIGVSVGVASLFAFLTTMNFLISLYSIISIVMTIAITVGSLVLLGWELGILESTTISVAVGMSIDFTLHYGVAYRLSPDLDREMRVICSMERMGSPIAMAALTTFLAGFFMMPSTILAYRHIGTFIMIVMTSSWFCSTFFFESLLRCFGPRGGFGQFHWPTSNCCDSCNREHVDKTIYSVTEMDEEFSLSTSSTNHAMGSETHELEPLTNHKSLTPHDSQKKAKFPRRLSRDLQRRLSGSSAGSRRDSNPGLRRDSNPASRRDSNQRRNSSPNPNKPITVNKMREDRSPKRGETEGASDVLPEVFEHFTPADDKNNGSPDQNKIWIRRSEVEV